MKGRNPSAAEKRLHDRMAGIGCIACRINGDHSPMVSIHHIDGRTKPGAHTKVLPLCAGHHQDGSGAPGLVAVHPWKRRFEAKYGRQTDLLAMCMSILEAA